MHHQALPRPGRRCVNSPAAPAHLKQLRATVSPVGWKLQRRAIALAGHLADSRCESTGIDGKPNLSGTWQTLTTANGDFEDHSAKTGAPVGQRVVEGGVIPYQDWALEKRKENYRNRPAEDPEGKCDLPGVPRVTYLGFPFQIFQGAASDTITILYEYAHTSRFIYTNGTSHPPGQVRWWMGDARGHWEDDTLVVDKPGLQ
jgi:hypothetical protein